MPAPPSSLRRQIWQEYRKSKAAVAALWIVGGLVLVALLAPLLATRRPLYCVYDGTAHFPAFAPATQDSIPFLPGGKKKYLRYDQVQDWRTIPMEQVVWAPVPYSPEDQDQVNRRFASPFAPQRNPDPLATPGSPLPWRFRHWMGTLSSGEDVLAHLIHGARISLLVGVVAIGIAAFIGTLLGSLAGYYGNTRLRIRRGQLVCLIAGLLPAWFYGVYLRRFAWTDAFGSGIAALTGQFLLSLLLAAGILAVAGSIGALLSRLAIAKKYVAFPLDSTLTRLMEIINSIPLLLLILSLSFLLETKSLLLVMAIIGCTSWTEVARLIRIEFLRIIPLGYMESARALGFSERRLIWRHAFPNALAPLLVVIAFGMGGAIITESALSFLGIGVPSDTTTWGKLLNLAKYQFRQAWWLALPPSFAIFLTVLSFNLIGERLRDVLDPRTDTGAKTTDHP